MKWYWIVTIILLFVALLDFAFLLWLYIHQFYTITHIKTYFKEKKRKKESKK